MKHKHDDKPEVEEVTPEEVKLPEQPKSDTKPLLEKQVEEKDSKKKEDDVEQLVGKDQEAAEKFLDKHKIENYRFIKPREFYDFGVDSTRLNVRLDDEGKVAKVVYG